MMQIDEKAEEDSFDCFLAREDFARIKVTKPNRQRTQNNFVKGSSLNDVTHDKTRLFEGSLKNWEIKRFFDRIKVKFFFRIQQKF